MESGNEDELSKALLIIRPPEVEHSELIHQNNQVLVETHSGQLVLYNQNEKRLILTKPKPLTSTCSLCGNVLKSNYIHSQYFHFLQESHQEFSQSFNQGYYDKFFVEQKKLGRGQRGSVFLAQHVLQGVNIGMFAVKAIPVGESHSWLVRMLKEVTLLGKLKHPNIVEYKHAWIETRQLNTFSKLILIVAPEVPCLFILMELANGGNLEEYINIQESEEVEDMLSINLTPEERRKLKRKRAEKLNKTWPPNTLSDVDYSKSNAAVNGGIGLLNERKTRFLNPAEIKNLFNDVCQGLSHLHQNGIIHRDLKPPNLLLSFNDSGIPRIMISDFGECEVMNAEMERVRTGATGTLEFMPPEMLIKVNGQYLPNHSLSADIWSLGVILYYLCFSTVPYTQTEDVDLLKKEIIDFQTKDLNLPETKRVKLVYRNLIKKLMVSSESRPCVQEVIEYVEEFDSPTGSIYEYQDADEQENIEQPTTPIEELKLETKLEMKPDYTQGLVQKDTKALILIPLAYQIRMEEENGDMSPKQELSLEQKEKLRKLSHTAIERKRRERIAHCMQQLKTMVPSNRNQDYLQKLTILENTVKYIRELQEKVDQKEFFSSYYRPNMSMPLPVHHVPTLPVSPQSNQSTASKVMDIDNLLS
ncbi:putative serine/threonine-protein kinase iks1 [Boothiomyces sp. JEL0838]|nr:putative serine/threonine-protein kinase iks1 [Boothiomyces sp. JEL0838]